MLRNVEEHKQQTREDYRALSARIDRLFYWILGLCAAIIVTIIGSAIWLGN